MESEKLFSVEDFTNVCRFISSRSIQEFTEMYISIGLQERGVEDGYAKDKFSSAHYSFRSWWCSLDGEYQNKIVSYIKRFYENKI